MEILLSSCLGPVFGAIAGAIAGKWQSNGALKACERAREACNHKVTDLTDEIIVMQARIVALEQTCGARKE